MKNVDQAGLTGLNTWVLDAENAEETELRVYGTLSQDAKNVDVVGLKGLSPCLLDAKNGEETELRMYG